MKFLVDQNLPASLAARLTAEEHQPRHTSDLGLDHTHDEGVFEWCRQNVAVLLTADKRLTRYLAAQRATGLSVVILRGYLLGLAQLEVDLLADLNAIEQTIAKDGNAVFSIGPDRPTRAQFLPLVSEVG